MEKTIMQRTFAVESLGESRYRLAVTYSDFVGLLGVLSSLLSSKGINIIRGTIDSIGKTGWIVLEVSATIHPDFDRLEKDLFTLLEKAYAGHLEEVYSEFSTRPAKAGRKYN